MARYGFCPLQTFFRNVPVLKVRPIDRSTDTEARGVTLQPIKSQVSDGALWLLPAPDIF
jgi:hypothetical protein